MLQNTLPYYLLQAEQTANGASRLAVSLQAQQMYLFALLQYFVA